MYNIILFFYLLIGGPRITLDRANFFPGLHRLVVTVSTEEGQRIRSEAATLTFQRGNDIV